MRNFKKFLALVLAMLMVSACAVSVSAAQFADQDAIVAADVNEAVNALADLGVIKGRDDGKFYPNDTLTREEACVIFAKLRAGSEGQKYEWLEETTPFADVTAKWSFAYINYAYRSGFMVGDGTNFNPKGILTIEQALCAAVKAYKGNGTKDDPSGIARYADRVEAIGEHAYWAGHYTDIAAELGLTENVPFNYTAACTRGTMAQIAYNLSKVDASIGKGFGLTDLTGTLTVVAADTATIGGLKVVRSVLEAALADNGFDGTLTDYIGAEFTVKYDAKNGTVYSAALKSSMLVFDSTDVILSINKDSNGNNTNALTLAGKTYRANKLGDNGGSGLIGGAGAYPEIAVSYIASSITGADTTVYLPVEATDADGNGLKILNNLPEHYKAFAYDDDTDGNYDRLIVKEYTLASIKANTKDAKDGVAFDTVTFKKYGAFTNYDKKENKAPIVYTGVDAVIDNETPNLVNLSYNAGTNSYVVDVLEVAATKTGVITGVVTGKSLKIGGETLAYDGEAVKPDDKYLEQTATVFTIAGKYVQVASVSSSEQTLMVESVKINADGNAVVTGYDVNNRFAKTEVTVIGITKGGKLQPLGAFRVAEENEQAEEVYLAAKKDGTKEVTFYDGVYYTFVTASKGVYWKSTGKHINNVADVAFDRYANLSVDANYVKYGNPAASWYNVDSPAVIMFMDGGDAGDKDVYDEVKYSVTTSLSKLEEATAAFILKDGKVKAVVVNKDTIGGSTIIASPLAEGNTIVQIVEDAHEIGYAANVYKAVDLINGKVVNVTGNATKGSYYVADAEYKLVNDAAIDVNNSNNQWVFDTTIGKDKDGNPFNNDKSEIEVVKDGILYSFRAFSTQLKKGVQADDSAYAPEKVAASDGSKKVYSPVNQVKIYAADGAKNIVSLKDNGANPVTIDPNEFVKRFEEKDSAKFEVKAGYTYQYTVTVKAEDATAQKPAGDYVHTVTFEAVDTYVVGDSMIIVIDINDKLTTQPMGTITPIVPAE